MARLVPPWIGSALAPRKAILELSWVADTKCSGSRLPCLEGPVKEVSVREEIGFIYRLGKFQDLDWGAWEEGPEEGGPSSMFISLRDAETGLRYYFETSVRTAHLTVGDVDKELRAYLAIEGNVGIRRETKAEGLGKAHPELRLPPCLRLPDAAAAHIPCWTFYLSLIHI